VKIIVITLSHRPLQLTSNGRNVTVLVVRAIYFSWNAMTKNNMWTSAVELWEGWLSPTERASVSAISLRHILASPGYAHWDNRGECQCHMDEKRIQCLSKNRSMYPSIFNRLRAIARYWSETATFSYPLHLTPPLGCSHWNSGKTFGLQKNIMWIMELPGSEDSLMIDWAVSTQYQRVTDSMTDER